MINRILLILLIAFFVALAGLFAGAETGMYQLSRLRLRLGVEKRRLSFLVLDKAMRDKPALLVSMLLGTNLAHYLATSIVTVLLLSRLETAHTAELFATLITAPMLFVFSELIPKNIFFYHSDMVMPRVSPVIFVSHKLFCWSGLVSVLKSLSRIFAKLAGSPAPSTATISTVRPSHIRAIIQETHEEDILSTVQTDIINRLVSISEVHIKAVMIPINKVQTTDVNSNRAGLLRKLKEYAFTRLLVYEEQPTNIIGFINIYDCLTSTEHFSDLQQFVKPIYKLGSELTVSAAINIMQRENQKIALVTRIDRAGRERPIGIVTMKDLVEELLGELAEW